ncbi:hypothetical protein FRB95_002796, partial [Tulasnella sp. JGI-2019a]
TPNASHFSPAFLAYDILLSIFFQGVSKGTLRSAGLVCQAWYEPAMDVLWAKHIYLKDLLAVLSPLETGIVDGKTIVSFTRLPTPKSWSIFRSHACRVKLGLLFDPLPDLTLNIHHALMWIHSTVKSLTVTLPPNGVTIGNPHVKMSEFVAEMVNLCPDLVDLRLWVAEDTAKPIGGLRSLRTVDLIGRDITAILFELANLPAVEKLIIHFPSSLPSQWPQWIITPFPELQTLHLGASYPGASTFLHTLAMGGSRLKELKITENSRQGDPGMVTRAAGEHRYLERLRIHSYGNTRISLRPLEHTFPCSSLTSLTLYVKGDILMVDEELVILGIGLPGIIHIRLQSQGSTRLTLRALSIAIMSWPYLETLSLKINGSGTVPPEKHTAPHRHLQILQLTDSGGPTEIMKAAWFIAGLSDVDGFQLESYENRIWDL